MFGKTSLTKDAVIDALKDVMDPDLHKSIVELGFVKNVQISGGNVRFDVELTTPACPVKEQLKIACHQKVSALPGVSKVEVNMTAAVRASAPQRGDVLRGVKNVVAVASGKGGVGKSTTAANLALALAQTGASVGLQDADIYGPSVPMMFGVSGKCRQGETGVIPHEAHGIKLMSMGFFTDENTPVIWRGPMVHGILQQFLTQVSWGELDYLVIDLPPGTGDAQLTLTQMAPLSGAVIVTTPQDVSLLDARKGLKMFQDVKVPVLGIVENMSYFECGHCHHRTEIFRHGGGRRTAAELGVPFLGEVPLDPAVVVGGDAGMPIVVAEPSSPVAAAYRDIAKQVAAALSVKSLGGGQVPMVEIRWQQAAK
ncbi:MAG: Mrp/NBP35 family ATP-binding protein [Acidobacteriota bacterium]